MQALDIEGGGQVRGAGGQHRSTQRACGPTSCAGGNHEGAELPRIRPSRGTHITFSHEDLPLVGGAIVPAGRGARSSRCPAWPRADRHHRRRLRGPLAHIEPVERRHRLPARRGQRLLRLALGPDRADRGVRRRAAADIHRRHEEVRRHLAQGRAVRDLLRADHDHRRQAHDLEANGQDGRRPAGRARRARRALPYAGDPARPGDRGRGAARVEGVPEDSYAALAGRYGQPRIEVLALAAERGELAQPIVTGLPDLLAEAALAARSEQARSIGDVLLRRTRLGLLAARELVARRGRGAPAPVRASPTCSRASSAGTRRARRGDRALRRRAHAEGLDDRDEPPAAGRATAAPRRAARAASLTLELGGAAVADGDRQRLAGLLQRRRPLRDARRAGARSPRAARGRRRHPRRWWRVRLSTGARPWRWSGRSSASCR